MKLVKKITAAATALMMAVGMMSFGASAYNYAINLHYNSSTTPSNNVTRQSWTDVVNSTTQAINITNFNIPYGSDCKVHVQNGMGLKADIYSPNTTVSKTVSIQSLGTKVTVSVELVGYSSGQYNVNGNVQG